METKARAAGGSSLDLPVLSGSMAPILQPGGRVRVDCDPSSTPRAGDIIVFRQSDRLVAHRLVLRVRLPGVCMLYQRGDAGGPGSWVRERQVIGVVSSSTAADGSTLYERGSRGAHRPLGAASVLLRDTWSRALTLVRALAAGAPPRRGRGVYGIAIGAMTLGVRVMPRQYAGLLAGYFGKPGAPGAPDARLAVHVRQVGAMDGIPCSLYHDKEVTPGGFTLAKGLVRGRHLPGPAHVELEVPPQLLGGHAIRIFEHVLHQGFHMAARARGEDCILVHSCGVVRGGQGYVFVGASGSGKSTIAELTGDGLVLNDEICMVALGRRPPVLHGTPFNGFFKGKVEGSAPLGAVFLIVQARAHGVFPVSRAEAVSALFQQIVPPVSLDEPVDRAAHERMLDAAARLAAAVPVYRLAFRRDAGFWALIDSTTQAARKGVPQ